eukprot:523818_1
MYGADGTPVTDESDDEDMNNNNNNNNNNTNNTNNNNNYIDYSAGGGGFTENVIDENDNIIIDDDGMDTMMNDNLSDEINWVLINYEGQIFRVPLTDEIRTFGDIKRYLLSKQQQHIGTIEITSSHSIIDPEINTEYQDDDDAMIANHKKLSIRWNWFLIQIMDGTDFKEDIRVAEDFTIQRIKEQVEKDRNIRLDQLSKDGLELQNDKTLREYNIFDNGHRLISRICVQIIDQECDLTTDILVCEFWSIEDVLGVYLQSSRREKHENARLSLNSEILDLQSTVYDEKIENQCVLYYTVGKYTVLVYDSEVSSNYIQSSNNQSDDRDCVEIEVTDNQTIVDIQEQYARLTRKPFMENDKILSNERQLEKDVPLFKLRIKDNEQLIIEREQQQKPAQYICAECGSIVSLRPYDAVQCRECFMNVVYKMRTTRVCQYNCR